MFSKTLRFYWFSHCNFQMQDLRFWHWHNIYLQTTETTVQLPYHFRRCHHMYIRTHRNAVWFYFIFFVDLSAILPLNHEAHEAHKASFRKAEEPRVNKVHSAETAWCRTRDWGFELSFPAAVFSFQHPFVFILPALSAGPTISREMRARTHKLSKVGYRRLHALV